MAKPSLDGSKKSLKNQACLTCQLSLGLYRSDFILPSYSCPSTILKDHTDARNWLL